MLQLIGGGGGGGGGVGVHKCYLCRKSSHVLMLPFQSTINNTNFGISNKKIATYDTVENSK